MSDKPELEKVAELTAQHLGYKGSVFCGKGAFKETYRTEDKAGRVVALKLVDRRKINIERTEREIEALKRCNSVRIAKIIATTTFTAPDNSVYDIVIEEFFDGGSLEDRLKQNKLKRDEVIELVLGLLLAIKELQPDLVHRDIKPANIMFRTNQPDPVLVDFGLVRDLSQSSLTASWLPMGPGTPFYASPEQLKNEKPLIDWRSDQFSIGVIASLLLIGLHPYQVDPVNANTAIYAVCDRRGPSPDFKKAMEQIGLSAITKMVQPWPVQRFPNPDQAIAELTK